MNFKEESTIEKIKEITELPRDIAIHINDALRLARYEPFVGCSAVSASVIVKELQISSGARHANDDEVILAPYILGDVNDPSSHIVRGVAMWRREVAE